MGIKRAIQIIAFCIIIFSLSGFKAQAASGNGASINLGKNGIVKVTFQNNKRTKVAISVKKTTSSKTYYYFTTAKKVNVQVPLTEGNGRYEVAVLVLVDAERGAYAVQYKTSIPLALKDSNKVYLGSNQIVNWKQKNAAIKYANKITKKIKMDYKKIQKIYTYIVKNYHYDYAKYRKNQSGNLGMYAPNIGTIYRSKKGICYDISALNASMLRSLGIKARLVTGYPKTKYYNGNVYHAWNKVYSKSKRRWYTIDATCDMCIYEQVKSFKTSNMNKKASQYKTVNYMY